MTAPTPRHPAILSTLRNLPMLRGTAKVEQCADDAAFLALGLYADIGLDSLEVVELGMEIEEAIGCEFTDADVGALVTIADVVALVERLKP